MKKRISLLVAFLLILSICIPASAEIPSVNWSTLTEAELRTMSDYINTELASRTIKQDENPVIGKTDNITIYLTRRYYVDSNNPDDVYLYLETVFLNNYDFDIVVTQNYIAIDGWDCNSLVYMDIPAGKNKKDNIGIKISDAGYTDVSQVKNLEFSFNIYDTNDYLEPIATTSALSYVR